MSKPNKQHLEDAWKEFERTGEICNAASGLLDYATVLVEINRLQSEECKQLQQDKAELLKALEVSTRAWDQYFKNGEMFDYDEYESHEKLLESMK